MKAIRYVTAAITLLMSLMNLLAGFTQSDMPSAITWSGMLLGVLGIVGAVALIRGADWAAAVTVGVGLLNVGAGIAAVANDWEGGPIGIALGTAISLLAAACLAAQHRRRIHAA